MSAGRFVLCMWLVAGCIEPQLKPCGDRLCAVDSVCLPSGTCATQESIDACSGHADGATCMTSIFTGSCVMGVCTAPRCGDGVVSGSEQCDGPVTGVDCVDYGFDTGVPSCSALCGLDVVDTCVRFGWDRVYSDSVSFAWTNGTEFALASSDYKRVNLYNGAQLIQNRTFSTNQIVSLQGNGSTVAVGLYDAIVRSDNGGPFVDVDVSALSGTAENVMVADDGSLYTAEMPSDGTRIFHQTGTTWTKILDVTGTATRVMWLDGHLYVSYDTGTVDRYTPGGAWTSFTSLPSPALDIELRPAGGYYIATAGSGTYELVGTTLTPLGTVSYTKILPFSDHLIIGGDDNTLLRFQGSYQEKLVCPIYGDLMTDGTNVFIYGNGVYRFTGTELSNREGTNQPANDVKLLGTGEIVIVSTNDVLLLAGYDGWDFASPTQAPLAAAGHSPSDLYVTEGFQLEHWNGSQMSLVTAPNGTSDMLDVVWDDATSTLYAAGTQGLAMMRVGSTWTMLTGITGCDILELALGHGVLYAAGTCGTEGAVWKLGGTTWSELKHTTFPLAAISLDDADNIYAVGLGGGVTQIAGTWKDEPSTRGVSISATGPNDIWVGGGPDDLVHTDGTTWSRVRVVGAATPHVLATPHAVYIAGASASVLVR